MSAIVSALAMVGFFLAWLCAPRIAAFARIVLIALIVVQIALLNGVRLAGQQLGHLAAVAALIDAAVALDVVLFARAWLGRVRAPLLLAPPFEGRWRVARGGPLRGLNHHVVARDQYFAYDFTAVGGASLGRSILAPVSGTIVAIENGMPDRAPTRVPDDPSIRGRELGNHVVIEAAGGYIFLCHLARGSVRVNPGDRIAAGAPLGNCGNSGRTTIPHLHVHAQDGPTYAFDRARGLPVLFETRGGPKLLWPFAIVGSR